MNNVSITQEVNPYSISYLIYEHMFLLLQSNQSAHTTQIITFQ
jgi:hypothetical protein